MQTFFANAVPTRLPDQLALAVTALILVFPAACLLSALLQPAPLSAHAIELLHTARRWCHFALGFALSGIAMIELSTFQQGHFIYDDLRSHVLWTHAHLGALTVSLLLIFGCHLLCRRSSTLSPISPHKVRAALLLIAVGTALLFHRHPLSHIPIAIWATAVVLLVTILAGIDFLASPPVQDDSVSPDARTSILRHSFPQTFRVALPGFLTLVIAMAATLGIARLQEHLARLHGDHLASQLEEITHDGTRFYPIGLPNHPALSAPWYLTLPVTYHPADSLQGYRLSYPLILHPGAQMHRDTHSPTWYWWGTSDW